MKFYRLLLHLYPARFREEYAGQMELQFRDDMRDANGLGERGGFWMKALVDLSVSIPTELVRELWSDVRYAARLYRQRKFVTALALGALALAMGATTGTFSVVNALLLRSLPYREPDRLVDISKGPLHTFATAPEFREHLKASSDYLDDGAIYFTNLMNVERNGIGTRLRVTETTANFFTLLGTEPQLGRAFLPDEHEPSKNQVAVLSNRYWQQDFGGSSSALGSQLAVNGVPFTIVGIAPPAMDYPINTDVWTATGLDLDRIPKGQYFVSAIGRLKSGLSLTQARAAYKTKLLAQDPKSFDTDDFNKPHMDPIYVALTREIGEASLILFATVAFILLIACANVAQLLLARLNERRQEITVRTALGATSARITQQLVTEALLLTLIAVAAGMGVAYWTAQAVSTAVPAQLSVQAYTLLDVRVLGFSIAVALLCALLFGVLPALLLRRPNPSSELSGTRTGTSASTARVRMGLMAVQAALTIVLLTGSVSLGLSFLKLLDAKLGFDTSQTLSLQVSLDGTRHSEKGAAPFYSEVASRIRAIPGVEAAGAALYLPLERYPYVQAASITLQNGQKTPLSRRNMVGDGFFAATRMQLAAGRDFTDAERLGTERAIIINEEIARTLGPNVVGQRTKGKESATIVGVARTVKWDGPGDFVMGEWFMPLERTNADFAAFAIRVRGDALGYIPAIRAAVQSVDPAVPIFRVEPMTSLLAERLAQPRFYATAITCLGGFALLLSAIGIYGVASNSVSQRTKEIGVRIAVGASASGVRAMLLRQTMLPLLAGLVAGTAGAILFGTYLKSLMNSAEPVGASVTAAAAGTLVLCCAVAVWRATARVARIDPMQALRAD